MKKRLVMALLLVVSLILTLSVSALAADENNNEVIIESFSFEINSDDIMPLRYSIIHSISASLDINGNTANCTGRVTTPEDVYKIQITMTLQTYSGGDWIEHTTWSRTAYNTNDFILAKPSTIGSGSYRVHVVGTVTPYEGSSETQTATSEPLP